MLDNSNESEAPGSESAPRSSRCSCGAVAGASITLSLAWIENAIRNAVDTAMEAEGKNMFVTAAHYHGRAALLMDFRDAIQEKR